MHPEMGHLVFPLFFNFQPVPDGYLHTQLSQISWRKVIAGSFLALPHIDECHKCEVFGQHLLHSHSAISSWGHRGFCAHTRSVGIYLGHNLITGISAGKCGWKRPAFTWNSQFRKTPVSQSSGSSRNQTPPGWFMVEGCSWAWFRAARLYFVLT